MIKQLHKVLLIIILLAGNIQFSRAALYTIEASDFTFSQPFDSVLVGDTVRWVWVNGTHTTTSNGIPFTALPWNVLLDKLHTSFDYVVSVAGTYDYISVPDAPQMGGEFVASWPTGIADPKSSVTDFNVIGNPARNTLQLHLTMEKSNTIDISLYNLLGSKIATVYHGQVSEGDFQQSFALHSGIVPGVYFVRLATQAQSQNPVQATLTRRIVIQ